MSLGVWLACKLLKSNLSLQDRNTLIIHILDKEYALPLYDIISTSEQGEILVNQKPLDAEKVLQLREHARIALDNKALKIIKDQVIFEAIALGVHKVQNSEQLIFARAGIWVVQRFEHFIKILAQRQEPPL